MYASSPQELERAWRDYDRMDADVTMAKTNLLERLEALGSPQVRLALLSDRRSCLPLV